MDKDRKIKFFDDGKKSWSVIVSCDGTKVKKAECASREEAENWVIEDEMRYQEPLGHFDVSNDDSDCDPVMEASIESFPSSDPPAWTVTGVKKAV